MRLSKLLVLVLATTAVVAARPAACVAHEGCCEGGLAAWYHTPFEPFVTWYAPNPWWPNYFGPPYPATDYLVVQYPGSPAETALAVRNQLAMMGIPPLGAKTKEPLPPPRPEDKEPPKGGARAPSRGPESFRNLP
jgi:hypothetical protein